MKELLGQDYLLQINVSEEEAEQFEIDFATDSYATPFTCEDEFRIYLIGEPSSAWNKGAARVFTEWLTINQKIITENEYEIDRIQKAFLSHIRYLHSLHLKSTRSRQAQDAKARRSVVDGRKRGVRSIFIREKH